MKATSQELWYQISFSLFFSFSSCKIKNILQVLNIIFTFVSQNRTFFDIDKGNIIN